MLELQTKIKRQIEIVGLCLDGEQLLRPVDLAVLFNCEELTIKRDLRDLRSYGIDIHSSKKRGVTVEGTMDARKLKSLIIQYIGLSNSENTFDKATMLMVKKLKQHALSNVVKLQRCIEQKTLAIIDYVKEEDEIERGKQIGPLQLFQSDGFWRVLALHNGLVKQYHLNKITGVRPTQQKFKPIPPEEIDAMFRYSFGSWVGSEKHIVRIKLSKIWADRLKPKQMLEAQVLTEKPDGSVVFETTVNSLNEIAGWVVSRGEGVEVLEPVQLRDIVIATARGTLKNYA